MSGPNNILVDTNLIIRGIGGNYQVRQLLEGQTLFISVITEIELLSIPFVNLNILLRKRLKIKLPDAIIAASSVVKKLPLFTADKGFSKIPELNVVLF